MQVAGTFLLILTFRTPLHWAIACCHREIIQMLLDEVEVMIDVRDNNGREPIHEAAFTGNEGNICASGLKLIPDRCATKAYVAGC